ncbi:MAG TPA: hypothetical protein PKD61_36940, partial [Polyangiaceae bacterium]|nr:hypothetical protein [Polyangiaceae bacterium]
AGAPLVVDVSEAYLPEAGTPASVKGCPQFPARLFDWRAVPELVGRSRAEILSCYGQPDDKSAEPWRYRMPRGCAYERTEIELSFAGDSVVRARARNFVTGQHCDFAF